MFTSPSGVAQIQLRQLIDAAVDRGDFTALAHDGSYKTLFSIIGQVNMSQQPGESHVIHTLMGLTGACPGFSLQSTEGNDSFGAAVKDRLPTRAIEQVRLLYSDAPSEGMLTHLRNCLGVAEDRLHIVIRGEYCTGGKRTACLTSHRIPRLISSVNIMLRKYEHRTMAWWQTHSARVIEWWLFRILDVVIGFVSKSISLTIRLKCSAEVLQLQSKFGRPLGVLETELVKEMYHGERKPEVSWNNTAVAVTQSQDDWDAYCKLPFRDHEEYVSELKRIVLRYDHIMDRKSEKQMSLRQVLMNGASPRHYYYLRNNNVFAQWGVAGKCRL